MKRREFLEASMAAGAGAWLLSSRGAAAGVRGAIAAPAARGLGAPNLAAGTGGAATARAPKTAREVGVTSG